MTPVATNAPLPAHWERGWGEGCPGLGGCGIDRPPHSYTSYRLTSRTGPEGALESSSRGEDGFLTSPPLDSSTFNEIRR
jgi:hypothetical protein